MVRFANSPLVSQIEFRSNTTVRLTTTKTYDKLNRLASIASVGTGSTPSVTSYSYSYNDANQRTRVNLADGSFWVYEYDTLGQVKSGKRYWNDWTPVAGQQFEYGFDDIGNRTSTKAGGDERGAALRAAAYTANNLNQITQRDAPAYLSVIGAATATATNVNVNNVMAYRRGEYYRVELNSDNSVNPVWQSVTNRAVQNGTTNSVTGNLFLPKHAEVFSYDADGNLTNDGRWAYVWDGENRLVRQFGPTTGPSGSVKALTYAYDWQSRRISKTVSNWNGSAWSKVLDEKYLYDGWNLLGSLNASNNAVVLAFLWGSDLSGTMQGAGGVGGLLAVKANGATVTFPAYDGNGNVTTLINAAGGNTLANYYYGPFGEVIRASGTAARTNPFRFSTKFQDDETDLLTARLADQQGLCRWQRADLHLHERRALGHPHLGARHHHDLRLHHRRRSHHHRLFRHDARRDEHLRPPRANHPNGRDAFHNVPNFRQRRQSPQRVVHRRSLVRPHTHQPVRPPLAPDQCHSQLSTHNALNCRLLLRLCLPRRIRNLRDELRSLHLLDQFVTGGQPRFQERGHHPHDHQQPLRQFEPAHRRQLGRDGFHPVRRFLRLRLQQRQSTHGHHQRRQFPLGLRLRHPGPGHFRQALLVRWNECGRPAI